MTILNVYASMAKVSLWFLSLLLFLIPTIVSASTSWAKVYVYEKKDGNHVITSQKMKNKHLRLIKVYRAQKSMPKKKLSMNKRKGSSPKTHSRSNCNSKQAQKRAALYKRSINVYSRIYGVDEALVTAIIKNESCFRVKAKSRVGAIGLMQLMPDTAKQMQISDPWDPEQNIQGGVKYIAKMLKLFKGNKKLAVAAYNAGPGKVNKYNGIPPYRETQNYVRRVLADYNDLKLLKISAL